MSKKKFIKPFKKNSKEYQEMLLSFNYILVVKMDFLSYKRGDIIKNPTIIRKVKNSEYMNYVIQRSKI